MSAWSKTEGIKETSNREGGLRKIDRLTDNPGCVGEEMLVT